MVDRTDILTSIHGRQTGLNSDDELVVNGKVHLGLTEEQAANTSIVAPAGADNNGGIYDAAGKKIELSANAAFAYSQKWPSVTTRKWGYIGDSRGAINDIYPSATLPTYTGPYSPAYYIQQTSEHRGDFLALHATNGATIQGCIDNWNNTTTGAGRLGARGNIAASLAAGVKNWVILIGVNDGSSPQSTTAPLYRQLVKLLLDNGAESVIVCDELPDNNGTGNGAVNILRHKFLKSISDGFDGKVIVANTYIASAISDDSFLSKPGFYSSTDPLHPQNLGNRASFRVVGQILGAILEQSGFKSQVILPLYSGDPSFIYSNLLDGTSGTPGANGSGQLATGMSANAVPGITHTFSKGVDEFGNVTQIWRVSGTYASASNTIRGAGMTRNGLSSTAAILNGSSLIASARIRVTNIVESAGFIGVGINQNMVNATDAITNARSFGDGTTGTWSVRDDVNGWDGEMLDYKIANHKVPTPSGWEAAASKNMAFGFAVVVAGGRPIDMTFEISRAGLRLA